MAFQKIDKALNLYYRALGHYDYYNDDGVGKFIEFCEENGLEAEEIEQELDAPDTCMYVEFDDDFPFVDKEKNLDEEKKNRAIFDVLKSCYQTGLPPDKYRPRKKNLTHKVTIYYVIDVFIDNIARQCVDVEFKNIIIPKEIKQLCTKYHLVTYNLMAPYDFKCQIPMAQIEECEKIFATLYMYHSKLPNKSDYEPLAIGYANKNFPFLFYILEAYDRDRIKRGCLPEKKYLKLEEWMEECDFVNEFLRQELEKESLYDAIIKTCVFYIRKWKNEFRVLPSKIEMERMYIKDDLYEITECILNIIQFVQELVANYQYGTKFQCEFTIAVRSTEMEVLTKAMIPDIDGVKDEEDESDKYKHHDTIGEFKLNMTENDLPYASRKIEDKKDMVKKLHEAFDEFKQKIEEEKFKERPSTFGDEKSKEDKEKYYTPFPKQRRFCCFVDRREYYHKTTFKKVQRIGDSMHDMMMMRGRRPKKRRDGGGMFAGMFGGMMGMPMFEWQRNEEKKPRDINVDEITFYTPDDQYLPIDDGNPKNGIYPESHFDIIHTSMIPELRIYDINKEDRHLVHDTIKGITSLHGALLNIQFQVERFDEIRIYIHWHNQCFRLYPQDFWLVLPRIFVKEYGKNKQFPKDIEMQKKIKQRYKFTDKYFDYFYKYISVYNQQEKEWIDKPTKLTYVN